MIDFFFFLIKELSLKFMICFQAVTVVGAKPHTKETDLIHEAPRWYPGLTVLRKKPTGAAAIPRGESSGHPLASLAG